MLRRTGGVLAFTRRAGTGADAPRTKGTARPMLGRTTRLALLGAVLATAAAAGCGTNTRGSARPQRIIELVVTLRAESGRALPQEPLEIRTESIHSKSRPRATDASGRWTAEFVDYQQVGWLWDALLPPPPLPRRIRLGFKLPSIHERALYPVLVGIRDMDAGDHSHAPPAAVARDFEGGRAEQLVRLWNGAAYRLIDGSLAWVEIAADGADTRLVPAVWDEPDDARYERRATPGTPGAPRLQVTVRQANLAPDRDRISIDLAVVYHDDDVPLPDPSP